MRVAPKEKLPGFNLFVAVGVIAFLSARVFGQEAARQDAFLKMNSEYRSMYSYFGSDISLQENRLAIAAPSQQIVSGSYLDNAGAVHLYERIDNRWTAAGSVIAAVDYPEAPYFGVAMDFKGSTLVVGSPFTRAPYVRDDGRVFVYSWPAGEAVSQSDVIVSAKPGVHFGGSVALDGDVLVIGATLDSSNATGVNGDPNNNDVLHAGSAYIYRRTNGAWEQEAYLKAPRAIYGHYLGRDVAVSGNHVIVASQGNLEFGNGVFSFVHEAGAWKEGGELFPVSTAAGSFLNAPVDFDGDTLAVGGAGSTSPDGPLQGGIFIFRLKGDSWIQEAFLPTPTHNNPIQNCECYVALRGDTVVIGKPDQANSLGLARAGFANVYRRHGTIWRLQTRLEASNSQAIDGFGVGLAVWNDTIVVGATGEDGNGVGVNADQSNNELADDGAAYVFRVPNSLVITKTEFLAGERLRIEFVYDSGFTSWSVSGGEDPNEMSENYSSEFSIAEIEPGLYRADSFSAARIGPARFFRIARQL